MIRAMALSSPAREMKSSCGTGSCPIAGAFNPRNSTNSSRAARPYNGWLIIALGPPFDFGQVMRRLNYRKNVAVVEAIAARRRSASPPESLRVAPDLLHQPQPRARVSALEV